MKTSAIALAAGAILLAAGSVPAQFLLSGATPTYSEDFNTLTLSTTAATWTDNVTLAHWYAQTGSGTKEIIAGFGNNNLARMVSLGGSDAATTQTDTDRALGSVNQDAMGGICYGVRLKNDSASAITQLAVSFDAKWWRSGPALGTASTQDFHFYYRVDTSFAGGIPAGTAGPTGGGASLNVLAPEPDWTKVPGLVYTAASTTTTPQGAINPPVVTPISHTFAASVPAGQELFLLFYDPNHSGLDHTVGIDNLVVTATFDSATLAGIWQIYD